VSARRRRVAYPTYENDAFAHAMALVAVPVLLGLLGAWLDSLAGTRPLLLLVFGAFGVLCSFASAYYRYEAKMARHDAGKPWNRKPSGPTEPPADNPGEIGEATP
jgi:F0F1-type ATP synthase assembly protein I